MMNGLFTLFCALTILSFGSLSIAANLHGESTLVSSPEQVPAKSELQEKIDQMVVQARQLEKLSGASAELAQKDLADLVSLVAQIAVKSPPRDAIDSLTGPLFNESPSVRQNTLAVLSAMGKHSTPATGLVRELELVERDSKSQTLAKQWLKDYEDKKAETDFSHKVNALELSIKINGPGAGVTKSKIEEIVKISRGLKGPEKNRLLRCVRSLVSENEGAVNKIGYELWERIK
jgi:hypothetical protein